MATGDEVDPTVDERPWSGWAIASLAFALSTIPVAVITVKADPGDIGWGAVVLTLTIVASLIFVVGVAVRVDWERYRGSWLVFTAGVVEIGWLLLMFATYQPAD